MKRWLLIAVLAGCGGVVEPDQTVTVRLFYNRSAYPNVGCLPCQTSAPMTLSAFDATATRCFPGCVISTTGTDSRLIDCSAAICGALFPDAKYYAPPAGDGLCGWTPPNPEHLSALCLR